MMHSWVLFTVLAALMQAVRTAGQKQLANSVSPMSSTLVRYVYGWPFVVAYLIFLVGAEAPIVILHSLSLPRFLLFATLASLAQILATVLLIKVFSFRNFAVGTSFAKTEAVQTAAFGTVFFGAFLSPIGWLAVLIGFIGIFIISAPSRKMPWEPMNVFLGLTSGASFALTSLWLREASLSLNMPVLQSAALTLFAMVSLQSLICLAYSVIKEPGQISLIRQRRRLAYFVGATSAFGSVGWFTAMTYQNPALVKSLGQVEIIFTLLLTTFFFKEKVSAREYVGVGAIVLSVILLLAPIGASRADDSLSPEHFPTPQANFSQHREQVRDYLLSTQMLQRDPADVEYNLPFDMKANPSVPYKGRFMLIHGLNDSPYVWRDMAAELNSRGFDVRAVLLPGHGNTPEAQLSISYKHWLSAAREHMSLYDDGTTPFFLGGFSLGGVIATTLALESGSADGLLLFSPAFKSSMHHLLRWSGIYSRFEPWVFGGMIIEDNPTKYNSIPINGATQYYKTTQTLRKTWAGKTLNIPVLIVASSYDSVVNVAHMQQRFKKGFIGEKKMIVYDNVKAGKTDGAIEYRQSEYLAERILNQSHQSVLLSAANPLFGKNGKILVCNGNDWPTFSGCLYYKGEHWYGAQHTESPDEVPVARSTYNPDFPYVLDMFDKLFMEQ